MAHDELIQQIQQMTVLELSQFVKELETVLGVSAAAPMMMAGPMVGGGGAAEAAPVEEQTEFDVVLQNVGEKKINVIKVVRALTNLGLKEAKDLVESAPAPVLQGVAKDVAADAKAKLEAEGASIQVK